LNAILKYGYSKFSIEILEYCFPEKCIKREQYYIDLLNPEYNILKKAGSSFGHKHGEETRVKMSNAKRGENNSMFGKKHSLRREETLIKMSNAQKGRPRQEGSGRPSQKIEVTDIKNNITITYDSITAAALALNIGQSTISKYLARKDQKFYKNQYGFKKL
jgi:group I intron endonuclease